jgi:hypothetical protein
MADLIGLRECGRRLGVSDTSVRKAIAKGRIDLAGKTDNGRPLVDWDVVKTKYAATADVAHRSHVGAQLRQGDAPRVQLPTSNQMDADGAPAANDQSRYAAARAVREEAEAALAVIKLEQQRGRLVEVEAVGAAVDMAFTRVRQRLLSIGNAAAPELLGVASVAEVQTVIDAYVRDALEELSAAYG